jgi:hypothetical protein
MNNTRDNDARRQRDLNLALTCAQGTYWDKVSETKQQRKHTDSH